SNCYLFDDIGNTNAWFGNNGGPLRYHAFGRPWINGGVPPFAFGGQHGYYTDIAPGIAPTQAQYVRRRYYDRFDTYRWLSRDPLGVSVQDINPYVYVGNRPLVINDALGTGPAAASTNKAACVVQLA